MQNLRVKDDFLKIDYDYFASEDTTARDVINNAADAVFKPARGGSVSSDTWDQVEELLKHFQT